MSGPTSPNKLAKHHALLAHAKRPHGIALIAAILFVVAWTMWVFFLGMPLAE